MIGVQEFVFAALGDGVALFRRLGGFSSTGHPGFPAHVGENGIPVLRGQCDAALVEHVNVYPLSPPQRRLQGNGRRKEASGPLECFRNMTFSLLSLYLTNSMHRQHEQYPTNLQHAFAVMSSGTLLPGKDREPGHDVRALRD